MLRGALGRPRRLSLSFLREERLRLEGHRWGHSSPLRASLATLPDTLSPCPPS
jgi:hypothetical protein